MCLKAIVIVDCLVNNRYCGKCCYDTEMILSITDIAMLTSIGYSIREYAVFRDSFMKLRNVDGHCIFLDPHSNKCTIYQYRPLGCRLYPLVYDPYRDTVVIDRECPRWREVYRRVNLEYYRIILRRLYSEALEAVRIYGRVVSKP